jgi:predicted transcriptional regulator YdeE
MEPKILNRDSFKIMGTSTHVTAENEKPELFESIWEKFESYHKQIKPFSTDLSYYGIRFISGKGGDYEYVAGMAVKDVVPVPKNLVTREIPSSQYAVFESPVNGIGETYRYIFLNWMPLSPFDLNASAPVFEQYPPEERTEMPVLIFIPVKEKSIE